MRKILMMFTLLMGFMAAHAQQNGKGYFGGLSRKTGLSRMIPPHGLEITYDKAVHVIFPSPIKYIDLDSINLIVGKADGAEDVIRVKVVRKHFRNETNMNVITEGGNFYIFNIKYINEPLLLNVEVCDFIHDGGMVNRPNNAAEIYLQELGSEPSRLVRPIMESIRKQGKHWIKYIGRRCFGVQLLPRGLYTHGDLFYLHTEVRNATYVPLGVDFVTFKTVDKKIVRHTAMQERMIYPLCVLNHVIRVEGKKDERTVSAPPKFTIPDDKKLVVEMYEKQDGYHRIFEVNNEGLVHAETISELQAQ